MTEEDIFGSTPELGSISYRLPSPGKIFHQPEDSFAHYTTMTFWVSIITLDLDDNYKEFVCKNKDKCKVVYQRPYTPTLYYLQPRITYFESTTQLFFNPASTLQLVKDLDTDEIPFINAKIGGNLIDFEG